MAINFGNGAYGAGYAEVPQREDNDPRPYDTLANLERLVNSSFTILDVGCGTAYKTLPLASKCSHFYGLEPSTPLLEKARMGAQGVNNVDFMSGKADQLPFSNDCLDLVISLLSPHDAKEAYRVLKPGGIFYLEKVGERDKLNLKQEFGSDDQGLRGYNCKMVLGERLEIIKTEFLASGFTLIDAHNIFYNCYYPTIDDFIFLLEEVNFTVRNFSREKDKDILQQIKQKYMTDRGIATQKHEIVVIGRK
ncbi:MAG: methyltransferase domain-containing protein [Nanoarchaeota archaeon]